MYLERRATKFYLRWKYVCTKDAKFVVEGRWDGYFSPSHVRIISAEFCVKTCLVVCIWTHFPK
jgi:hypothetical protein